VDSAPSGLLAGALGGIVISMLLVGVVSHTPIRHLVQVVPVAFALVALWRRAAWAPYAALPLCLFWLLIMTGIWFFLLGIARIITGTFSPAEITLTITTGLSCLAGLVAWWRVRGESGVARQAAAFVSFALLQLGAMWLSLQPPINRS
jgi:hypothetical protein